MDKYELLLKNKAFDLLHRDAAGGGPSHAYLLISPDPAMTQALCDLFLADCIYKAANPENAARAARTAADVIRLPAGDKVLVDDVKELTDTVYFTPTELDKKYYVIARAETMNDASQNKLLKVLEEPPSSVVIVLLSGSKEALLGTVLSRVRTVEVGPSSDADLARYLAEKYGRNEKNDLALALSGGLVGKAESIMEGKSALEAYRFVMDMLLQMKTSRNVSAFSARAAAFKDDPDELTDVLEIVLGDAMLVSSGRGDAIRLKGAREDIERIARDYTAEVAVKLRPVLMRARKRARLNGNVQSITDELLFSLLEVKAKCRK